MIQQAMIFAAAVDAACELLSAEIWAFCCAELHDRIPVVIGLEAWQVWLGEEPADPRQLKALLVPYPLRGNDVLAGSATSRTTTQA